MTPAELLVLAFLAFNPLPVCTFAFPHGDVLVGKSCPPGNMWNDFELFHDGKATQRCVRRFKA